MSRDELDKACRDETKWAMTLDIDARSYVTGHPEHDVTTEQFLATAYTYAKARMELERLQDQLWGELP